MISSFPAEMTLKSKTNATESFQKHIRTLQDQLESSIESYRQLEAIIRRLKKENTRLEDELFLMHQEQQELRFQMVQQDTEYQQAVRAVRGKFESMNTKRVALITSESQTEFITVDDAQSVATQTEEEETMPKPASEYSESDLKALLKYVSDLEAQRRELCNEIRLSFERHASAVHQMEQNQKVYADLRARFSKVSHENERLKQQNQELEDKFAALNIE